LVDWDDLPRWTVIDKTLSLGNPEPPETYSNSPHVYDELDIPTDVTGTVGAASRNTDRPKRAPRDGERPKREARDGDRPARNRDRTRQRTRGGNGSTGHVENTEQPAQAVDGETTTGAEGASPARRRRRRRRPNSTAPTAG
jgi:hypothetical protein